VQGTINGLGERCGNADLCSVLPGLQLKMGFACVPQASMAMLSELAAFVDDVANLPPHTARPYVGRSAFAHKGGIHVSAVMKDPRAYEHLAPEEIGNRRRVLVSDLSGSSNIRYKAKERGIDLGDETLSRRAVERIKELEHDGYSFEGAEASFEILLRQLQGQAPEYFALERFHVRSEHGTGGSDCTEATIAVSVGIDRVLVASEGAGPVDALSQALRSALRGFYPDLERMNLSDYKVRVINPEDGTAARVRVLVEHQAEGTSWSTVGVSDNILTASAAALCDGVRWFLAGGESATPRIEVAA
jgi:2-isopropylmalate synthase